MKARRTRLLTLLGLTLACMGARADEPQRAIVQQRMPDGSILLTDRPQANAKTERSWQVPVAPPGEAASAAERRAKAEADAAAVNERLSRQLEQQRDRDAALEIERQRAAAAQAERQAAIDRQREVVGSDDTIYGYPGYPIWPPQHVRPPRPPRPHPAPHYTYEPPPPALPVIKPKPREDLQPQRPARQPRQ